MVDNPDFVSPPRGALMKYMAEEYLAGGYSRDEAQIQRFIDTVTNPDFYGPLLGKLHQQPDENKQTKIVAFQDAEYNLLNAIKCMDKHELFTRFNALMESGVPYQTAIRTMEKLEEQTPEDKIPLAVKGYYDAGVRLSVLEHQRKTDPSAPLPSLKDADAIHNASVWDTEYRKQWDPIFNAFKGKWIEDSWGKEDGGVTLFPKEAVPEKYRQHFDYSQEGLLTEYQNTRTQFESEAEKLSNTLDDISKKPAIMEQRSKHFLRFAPNDVLLKHILDRPSPYPVLPEGLEDVKTLEILENIERVRQSIWQQKQQELPPRELMELFDPNKHGSVFKEYLDKQPAKVQREIRNMMRYIQEHPELLEKYGSSGLIDQFHHILLRNLHERTEPQPALKEKLDALPDDYRHVPSGSRCSECDEELRKHYNAMKEAVLAMDGSAVTPTREAVAGTLPVSVAPARGGAALG